MAVRFDVVGIVAGDMARSLAFYRQLGLDIPAEADDAPHVEHSLGGGVRMMWDTPEVMTSFDAGWSPPSGSGHSISLAFACANAAEVDEVYAQLTSAGYSGHLAPFAAEWGQRYAVLKDPDGNTVDLFALLPEGEGGLTEADKTV